MTAPKSLPSRLALLAAVLLSLPLAGMAAEDHSHHNHHGGVPPMDADGKRLVGEHAYVLHFSEALWAELRPRGVTVTTLCPGTTRTEFFDHSGVPGWAERNRGQDVQTVVRTGLAAFDAGRQYVIPGWMNYLVSLAVRLATRATVVKWSLSIFRPRLGRESL